MWGRTRGCACEFSFLLSELLSLSHSCVATACSCFGVSCGLAASRDILNSMYAAVCGEWGGGVCVIGDDTPFVRVQVCVWARVCGWMERAYVMVVESGSEGFGFRMRWANDGGPVGCTLKPDACAQSDTNKCPHKRTFWRLNEHQSKLNQTRARTCSHTNVHTNAPSGGFTSIKVLRSRGSGSLCSRLLNTGDTDGAGYARVRMHGEDA